MAALELDEAVLTVLYTASGKPVLLESVRALWQRCRAYKIRGAQRASDLSDRTLWSFQERLVDAAHKRDGAKAAGVTRESMLSALDRIGAPSQPQLGSGRRDPPMPTWRGRGASPADREPSRNRELVGADPDPVPAEGSRSNDVLKRP